jgi:hypothetical protein
VPGGVGDHAAERIRYIRDTMAAASEFTAVPGAGAVVMGGTALVAAVMAARSPSETAWVVVWLVEAAIAACIGAGFAWRKARALHGADIVRPARRFFLAYLAPLAAGVILTIALLAEGQTRLLAGTWLLLYGTAAVCGGTATVRPIRHAGFAFMALGIAALLWPGLADWWMAAGFGGLHLLFGSEVARKYGG